MYKGSSLTGRALRGTQISEKPKVAGNTGVLWEIDGSEYEKSERKSYLRMHTGFAYSSTTGMVIVVPRRQGGQNTQK